MLLHLPIQIRSIGFSILNQLGVVNIIRYRQADGFVSSDAALFASGHFPGLHSLVIPPILDHTNLLGTRSTYLAAQLADKTPVAGLILESTFSTIFQVVTRFNILPFDKFPTIQRIDKINCPLLILHGTDDQTIPFSHSEAPLAAAHEPKQLVPIAKADHNNLL